MKKSLLAVTLALALGACATPQTPQQAVFQTKQSYATALTAATAYKRLPGCTVPVVHPCSDRAVVEQLQKADAVAFAAIDSAEKAVRTPGFGKDVVTTSVAAAESAFRAFAALIANLGVRK